MKHIIGRVIGMAMQIIGVGLIINDHANPLLYEPFFGSIDAEKLGGIAMLVVGVLVYLYNYGQYSLITYGSRD